MRAVPNSRFLFRRAGSQCWYYRTFDPETGKYKEKSTAQTDIRAAEIVAADHLKVHKAIMFRRRQARVASIVRGPWQPEYPPGLFTTPDGRTGIATLTDLTFADGTRSPNGGPMIYLQDANRLDARQQFAALDDAWDNGAEGPVDIDRPSVAVKNPDDPDAALLENYIIRGSLKTKIPLTPAKAKEARKLFETFKTLISKPLADCTMDDGYTLIAFLEAEHLKEHGQPIKAASLRRMLVPLISAVNRAIAEKKLAGPNPFVSVVTNREGNGSVDRDYFTEADMKLIRDNEHKLSDHDRLLLRLLATTGIRRGEAFQIGRDKNACERREDGIRFVVVSSRKGDKGEVTYRRIPFPADVLPLLPAKISGPLFSGHPGDAVKRLGKFLADIGVINDHDNRHLAAAHSFRHRFKRRLRDATSDDELRDVIGGWANGNKGRKYGGKPSDGDKGFPVSVLKATIDKIGF